MTDGSADGTTRRYRSARLQHKGNGHVSTPAAGPATTSFRGTNLRNYPKAENLSCALLFLIFYTTALAMQRKHVAAWHLAAYGTVQ
jgi:hypothetical protein